MKRKYCPIHGWVEAGNKRNCPRCDMPMMARKTYKRLWNKAYCYSCDDTMEINFVRLTNGKRMPICVRCGGCVKPGTAKRENLGHVMGTHELRPSYKK